MLFNYVAVKTNDLETGLATIKQDAEKKFPGCSLITILIPPFAELTKTIQFPDGVQVFTLIAIIKEAEITKLTDKEALKKFTCGHTWLHNTCDKFLEEENYCTRCGILKSDYIMSSKNKAC